MNNKFDEDYIMNYLMNKYKEINHNPTHMTFASLTIGKKYKCCPKAVFHFMIENRRIPGIKTHFLWLLTQRGKKIRSQFTDVYLSIMFRK